MSGEPDGVETAIQRYREGSVSIGRAAELADVSIRQFIEVLDERDVKMNYDESDLEDDLRAVQAGKDLTD